MKKYEKPLIEFIYSDDLLTTSFLFETNVTDGNGTIDNGSDFDIIN